MKKFATMIAALVLAIAAQAQTMNVVVGNTVYQFPAAQVGDMNYSEGTTLTIMGKAFTVTDIEQAYIDETQVSDNTVSVSYNNNTATVYVAGNVAQYVTPTVSGAHVSIEQSTDVSADNVGEITYSLSGSSSDGEFYLTGSYKTTVELNGLTLTNATPVYSGAAINIQNGKRIDISVKKDTENTLTDAASGSQKACLVVKGHAEFKGKGTLNVYGLLKHGIKTGEYMSMKNCTINVLKAAGDGIHASEYFLMESGTISISGVSDDGIQAEVDGTSSTGETTDHEDEDSGNIYIQGGTLNIATTAVGSKGIKADGTLKINEESSTTTITVTNSGGVDTSDSSDLAASACLKSETAIIIDGGTLTLTNTGQGGRAINCGNDNGSGALTINGGTINAKSSGSNYGSSSGGGWGGSSSNHKYAKGIKAKGALTITGGTVNASSTNHEGIESKSTIDISGGYVYAYAGDDAINASGNFTITGGFVMGNSTGNDGLDANGNFYIKGGTVFAVATTQPEVGIDANTEGGYKLYVTGGNIIAIGGLESGSSLSQTCYQASSYSKGTWYGLYNNGTLAAAFKVPSNSSMGSGLVVSTSGTTTLKSGVSISSGTDIWSGFGNIDGTVSGGSTVSLSTYSGGNGGGGFGPGGGGGPGGRW